MKILLLSSRSECLYYIISGFSESMEMIVNHPSPRKRLPLLFLSCFSVPDFLTILPLFAIIALRSIAGTRSGPDKRKTVSQHGIVRYLS